MTWLKDPEVTQSRNCPRDQPDSIFLTRKHKDNHELLYSASLVWLLQGGAELGGWITTTSVLLFSHPLKPHHPVTQT